MDSKQIDVMVADASHEVYVDKILDTIREAAKVLSLIHIFIGL